MKGLKSIKASLVLNFSIGITISFIIIFGIACFLVQNGVCRIKRESMEMMVEDASKNLDCQIDMLFATAYTIAADPNVYTTSTTFEQKQPLLVEYAKTRGISSIGYITSEGYLRSTDGFENDISDRDYFKELMNGGKYISNPSFNTQTQKQIIFIGVPIYENGKVVAAMTCTFDSSYMSQIISDLKFGDAGEAYMLGSSGVVVAARDMNLVIDKYNVIKLAQEDSSLEAMANLTQEMIDNEHGNKNFDGFYYQYEKVNNSNGWTIVFKLSEKAFYAEVRILVLIFIALAIIGIVCEVILALIIGSNIGKRLMSLKTHLVKLAEGDFSVELESDELNKADEIGVIYNSLQKTIEEIGNTLNGLKAITDNLSEQASTLDDTSRQLSEGTHTVNDSMNEIQKGNSEQADEIENINMEMTKFNANAEQVDTDIEGAVVITTDATHKLRESNKEMKDLQGSFDEFNSNFEKFRQIIDSMNNSLSSINLITSTIADIADQTTLLSLNASIEAARAGEVGKGFAVVAQEISKLADQCSTSVGDISSVVSEIMGNGTQLVESTSEMGNQIQVQNEIISETLVSFEKLSDLMEEMLPQIERIAKISKDNLVTSKVIGDSIQNANAISEELVATTTEVGNTSDEFNASSNSVNDVASVILNLAEELKSLSDKFKIK